MAKYTNNVVAYGTVAIIFVVAIIMVLVFMITRPMKSPAPQEAPAAKILIIERPASGSGGYSAPPSQNTIPHYPSTLPRYTSGNIQSDYQQVGLLTSHETDKEPIVLPLFGRKVRSDRWQYYTATDKNNLMRIPLQYQNQDCEEDIGCREIYSGDKLTVSIYQDRVFTATVYRTEAPRYFADRY